MNLVRPIPVVCAKTGKHLGFAEGNLRLALIKQAREDRPRRSRTHEDLPACGRNREKLEALLHDTHSAKNLRGGRKGEDRSWKYNRFQPRPRTLCKRARRKAQYN